MANNQPKEEYPGDIYDPFLTKVEELGYQKTRRYAIVGAILSLAYISLISIFFSSASNLIQALLSFPFVISASLIALGVSHAVHIEKQTPKIKDKYPPKQRYKFGALILVVLIVISLSLSGNIPYAIGGSLFLLGILGVYNLVRASSYENYLRINKIDDPREIELLEEDQLTDFDWDEVEESEEE